MTRINLFRTAPNSIAWGKTNLVKNLFDTSSPFIFAVALIVCSLAVGCSSEKPQPVTSNNQAAIPQPTPQIATTMPPTPDVPVPQATTKPVHRRVVRKAPATATYTDKTTGVSFQYPRGYALKTGDAAVGLLSNDPYPMDFTQPGGVSVAVVALPESIYPNSDFATAYFDVSVNKTLSADQCGEFSIPQPDSAKPSDPAVQATAQVATPPISRLLIGDLELQSNEMSMGTDSEKGPREESSKYYHVFQNGACYEFALKVSTIRNNSEQTIGPGMKTVDHDEVFHRLEKILATVKISPTISEVNAEVKTTSAPSAGPAQ
jgi:hypothetical protein